MKSRSTSHRILWVLAFPPILLLFAFFVAPLSYLLFVSFMTNSQTDLFDPVLTLVNYADVISDPFYSVIIRWTLLTTVVVLIACLLLGYPVAMYAAPPIGSCRSRQRGAGLLQGLRGGGHRQYLSIRDPLRHDRPQKRRSTSRRRSLPLASHQGADYLLEIPRSNCSQDRPLGTGSCVPPAVGDARSTRP